MKVTTDGCLFGAWVAEKIGNSNQDIKHVLDIGTGTGLLSLVLAQKNKAVHIDAVEIDKDAAAQAIENVILSSWAERIKVYPVDAKEFQSNILYDLIISNPPFYENELKSGIDQKNVAHHSQDLSLKELIAIIKKCLKPDGFFCLLLPYKRNAEVKVLLSEQDMPITQITFVRQSNNHDFFRIMLTGKSSTAETAEIVFEEIAIKEGSLKNASDKYTPAFINLLKEYYLHL